MLTGWIFSDHTSMQKVSFFSLQLQFNIDALKKLLTALLRELLTVPSSEKWTPFNTAREKGDMRFIDLFIINKYGSIEFLSLSFGLRSILGRGRDRTRQLCVSTKVEVGRVVVSVTTGHLLTVILPEFLCVNRKFLMRFHWGAFKMEKLGQVKCKVCWSDLHIIYSHENSCRTFSSSQELFNLEYMLSKYYSELDLNLQRPVWTFVWMAQG